MSGEKLHITPEQALVLSGADSLPVDLDRIADFFGIRLVSYADCAATFEITQEELYVCAVNENACGDKRRRWTLAHELAHCLLGHIGGEWLPQHSREEERSAEQFAAGLLAPLTVLHFAGVDSAQRLERLCGISEQAAEIRYGQLCAARRMALERGGANPFLSTESDRRLLAHFMPFITNELCRRALYGAPAERRTHGDMAYAPARCGKGA